MIKISYVYMLSMIILASYLSNSKDIDPYAITDEDLRLPDDFEIDEQQNNPYHKVAKHPSHNPLDHHNPHNKYSKPNNRRKIDEDEFDDPDILNDIPEHMKNTMGNHHGNPAKPPNRKSIIPPSKNLPSNIQPQMHDDFMDGMGPGHIPRDFNSPKDKPKDAEPTEEEKERAMLIYRIEVGLELASLALFSIFILNYLLGKIQNYSAVERWNSGTKEFFIRNYAHVGFGPTPQYDMPFAKQSNYEYMFYSSGRKNINTLHANFFLKKRYNLFQRFSDIDTVKYQIETDFETPYIMCLCDKKQQKIIKKNQLDVNYFTEYYPDEVDSEFLGLNTEDLSVHRALFDDTGFREKFKKVTKSLMWLHVSDRRHIDKFETCIGVVFSVGKSDESNDQLEFLHELVDRLRTVKIGNLKQANKKRDEFQNKLISELDRAEARNNRMNRMPKQTVRENINQKQEDEKKKIIKLTPPPVKDFKFK